MLKHDGKIRFLGQDEWDATVVVSFATIFTSESFFHRLSLAGYSNSLY
jgi:hypothetical protein